MVQQQRRATAERTDVRRLAAQLGIAPSVLQLDDDENSASGNRSSRPQQQQRSADHPRTSLESLDRVDRDHVPVQMADAPSSASHQQHAPHRRNAPDDSTENNDHGDDDEDADGAAALLHDTDADELEESLDQYPLDSTELPDSLALASDSNSLSASESVSSDLSLPRSFGRYDAVRAARRSSASRTPLRGISQFDDHLMHFPVAIDADAAHEPLRYSHGGVTGAPALAPSAQATSRRIVMQTHASVGAAPVQSSDVMKRFYEVQVEKIRSQLALATQAQRQLEKTLQDERAVWSDTLARVESERAAEKRRLEQEKAAVQSELQCAQQRLALEKTHLTSLQISDALAEQLARQDERDLSVKEFVQLVVHRKVTTLERDLEAARRDVEALERTCATHKVSASTASDEAMQARRVAEAQVMRLQHELELSEATRGELERQIATLCAQIDATKDAHQQSNAAAASRAQLESELETLRSHASTSASALTATETRCKELQTKCTELEQQVALLSADKRYLQDAKAQLEAHEAALLTKQHDLLAKVDALQATHERDMSESVRLQTETRLHFEQKLEAEVAKFLETSARELERIRSSGQIVYERENRLLKEARDDALQQTELLQAKLELAQRALEAKVLETTRMESNHATALASVRNDLKMQHFEANQLKLSLEEQRTNCRAGRLEIEMLTQKVQVHKEEFAKLEATSTARIAQLEAALERSKLKEYEQLEVDLDDAVLQTGAVLGSGDAGLPGAQDTSADRDSSSDQSGRDDNALSTKLSEAMSTFGAIPSSSKRRFQQSVALAQRVVKYQREALACQQRLESAALERRALESDLMRLRAQLAHVHQPQSYLLDKLKRNEQELQQAQRTVELAQQQVQALRSELAVATEAKMALQRQLQEVLARRSDLDALKTSVTMLQQRLRVESLHDHQSLHTPDHVKRQLQQGTLQPHQVHTLGSTSTAKLPTDSNAASTAHTLHSSDDEKRRVPQTPVAAVPSPFLKQSPPPSIVSKMTEAPSPQLAPQTAAASERRDAGCDFARVVGTSELASSPPRWYTKLRS